MSNKIFSHLTILLISDGFIIFSNGEVLKVRSTDEWSEWEYDKLFVLVLNQLGTRDEYVKYIRTFLEGCCLICGVLEGDNWIVFRSDNLSKSYSGWVWTPLSVFGIEIATYNKVITEGVEELFKEYWRNDFVGRTVCGRNRDRITV